MVINDYTIQLALKCHEPVLNRFLDMESHYTWLEMPLVQAIASVQMMETLATGWSSTGLKLKEIFPILGFFFVLDDTGSEHQTQKGKNNLSEPTPLRADKAKRINKKIHLGQKPGIHSSSFRIATTVDYNKSFFWKLYFLKLPVLRAKRFPKGCAKFSEFSKQFLQGFGKSGFHSNYRRYNLIQESCAVAAMLSVTFGNLRNSSKMFQGMWLSSLPGFIGRIPFSIPCYLVTWRGSIDIWLQGVVNFSLSENEISFSKITVL